MYDTHTAPLPTGCSQYPCVPVRLRIHWFSEEISTLAEGRQGRVVFPFKLPLRLTAATQDIGCTITSGEPIFDPSFHQSFAEAFAPVDPAPLLSEIARVAGSAVQTLLSQRLAQGQSADHAVSEPVTVPLHLPILDRRVWHTRENSLRSMTLAAQGGALYASGAGLNTCHQHIATLSCAVRHGTPGMRDELPLHFAHTVTASPDLLTRLRPVLNTYGFGPDLEQYLDRLTGPAEVAFEVSLPARFKTAWVGTPGETAVGFLAAYRPVAHSVQRSMRRWLPILALPTLENLADLDISPAVLTYAASRSFVGRSKTQLAYDILENVRIGASYSSAQRALPPVMAYTSETLLNAGYITSGRHFRPFRLPEFVGAVRRDKRLFPGLLKLDSILIDDLIKFAATAREVSERSWRHPQRAYGLGVEVAERFGKRVHNRLSYLLPKADLGCLRTLILLEATAALVGKHERRAVVTIGGKTFLSHPVNDVSECQCAA